MNTHPCKHGKLIAADRVECRNASALKVTGQFPTLGVCLKSCAHYEGQARGGIVPSLIVIEKQKPRLDCIHRGDLTRETDCPTCTGKQRLKVYQCAKYYEATIGRQTGKLACCASCNDYEGKD